MSEYVVDSSLINAAQNLQAWQLRDRQYRLIIEQGGRRITIGAPVKETNMSAHIRFQVERTDGKALNMATINVWNLNEEQVTALLQENAKVYLKAGYGSDVDALPMVFQGTVIRLSEAMTGADKEYTINAVDGFQELYKQSLSLSFPHNTTYYDVYREIGRQIGVAVVFTAMAEEICKKIRVYKSLAFCSRAEAALDRLNDETGLVWTVEASVLHIKGPATVDTESKWSHAYHLSAKTSLIGLPERIYESSVTTNENVASGMRYALYGYKVEFFMNAALQIRDAVYLDSSVAKGLFQIYKMTITGDNYQGDWMCVAEICEYRPARTDVVGEEYKGGYVARLQSWAAARKEMNDIRKLK